MGSAFLISHTSVTFLLCVLYVRSVPYIFIIHSSQFNLMIHESFIKKHRRKQRSK